MPSEKSFARVMTVFGDSMVATVASLWPRSDAAIEARRLIADGYPKGEPADVYFLVSCDGVVPDELLAAVRAAGFSVREPAQAGGFATIRMRIRLGAFALTMTGKRLDRMVEPFGGFATLIGAARPANEEAARPVRVASRHATVA
jgi:hypothetical protein